MSFADITSKGLRFNEIPNHDELTGPDPGYAWEFTIPVNGVFPDINSGASPDDPNTPRWITAFEGTFAITPRAVTSDIKYFSPSLVEVYGNFTGSQGYAIKNSASLGEAIVHTVPITYWHTSSWYYSKMWGTSFNTTDASGNNNTATLNYNGVQYSFPLDNLSNSGSSTVDSSTRTLTNKTYSSTNNSYLFQYTLTGNSSTNSRMGDATSLASFDPYIDPSAINFENSDYYATLNNFNDNRQNTYIMNLEYDDGITTPSNLTLVKSKSAEKAQTPDSNYTMKKVTKPRYEGVKLQSANYNFYTQPSTASFLNGTTGSWGGDVSYGRTAAINKNPIYFAHFKSSKENYELWDSYTFRIDQLIRVPFEDIQGNAIEPEIIKVDGSNSNLLEIVSTFEKDRKAVVAYNRGRFKGVDYTALPVGNNVIFQGGLEYNFILGTQKGRSTSNYIQTSSFVSSSWLTFGFVRSGSNPITQSSEVTLTEFGGPYLVLVG